MKIYRLTLLFLAFAGLLSSCSGGGDYREPKSEEDLSGLVLAASNGSYYQQKYENAPMCNFFLRPAKQTACRLCGKGTPMSM